MEIAYSRSSVGYLLGEVQIWVRLRYVAFCACVYLGVCLDMPFQVCSLLLWGLKTLSLYT